MITKGTPNGARKAPLMVQPLPPIPSRIIVAPMGGGPSTPQLVAGAGDAGGLGFLASGYLAAAKLRDAIHEVRALSDAPFGVNIFTPSGTDPAEQERIPGYVDRLRPLARALGVEPGMPVHTDDDFAAKIEVVLETRPAVVSFTFGLPEPETMSMLHRHNIAVAVTITEPDQVDVAAQGGADCLIVQGWEAGAHRGGLTDSDVPGLGLLPFLRLVAARTELPIVAAGGLADGAAIAAALVGGADAAMLGTAFMRCPEAGTDPVHAAALTRTQPTTVTRAFTGRSARAMTNRFIEEFSPWAPAAYPEVHHATSPLRTAARKRGDVEHFHLWAGQAHELAQDVPVRELLGQMARETQQALTRVTSMALGEQAFDTVP
jgi:nitronate monooxygenase